MNKENINHAVQILKREGVIAYPTEAMFGLGCDINSETAIKKILDLKKRSWEQGLIIVASSWEQVSHLTTKIPEANYNKIFDSWPGHTTWVFPASLMAPKYITGTHKTIAIRISNHPLVHELCLTFNGPIVSTSANIQGQKPALNPTEVKSIFGGGIDYIFPGEIGKNTKASTIIDATTLEILRF